MYRHMDKTQQLQIGADGAPAGPGVEHKTTRLGDLTGVFADEAARAAMDQEQVVYRVAWHQSVAPGTAGGLLFGWTEIAAGRVGEELFMTRGHFHEREACGEYYWGLSGEGLLLLMDRQGSWRSEEVRPGSLHYIPGHTAHRMINTGSGPLRFGACWPADAGHDYGSILERGFSARVLLGGDGCRVVPA